MILRFGVRFGVWSLWTVGPFTETGRRLSVEEKQGEIITAVINMLDLKCLEGHPYRYAQGAVGWVWLFATTVTGIQRETCGYQIQDSLWEAGLVLNR